MAVPWKAGADSVTVTVRLTPKGGRDALDGIEQIADGTCVLKVRVRAAPVEGAANDALVRLIAKAGEVPPSRVAIAAGASSRVKRVMIGGDSARIIAALEKSLAR
jgi:uncharacterized protein